MSNHTALTRLFVLTLALSAIAPTHAYAQKGEPAEHAPTEPAPTKPTPTEPASNDSLVPPAPLHSPPATYPKGAASTEMLTVTLAVTVGETGMVRGAEVIESAGDAFDAAALAAALQWKFTPATRNGTPIAARIHLPFVFAPTPATTIAPASPPAPTKTPASAPESAPTSTTAPTDDLAGVIDVTVRGKRETRQEQRAAGDFVLERDQLTAAPRSEGAEVLRSAPGVHIGRSEGAAVAHSYTLRGFDAEHGQDIAFSVGGVPINLPSHIHGQGYADLGFLIADVVSELQVSEGVSDPRQGDFAVAGSFDVQLGVSEAERGITLRSSFGRFRTFRQLVVWAPKSTSEESFGAVSMERTDGFGQNRAGRSATAILQHRFGKGDVTYRTLAILRTARASLAGVVRRDDVQDGTVCFTCVYPFATAEAQNAHNTRFIAGFFADYEGDEGSNGQIGLWLNHDAFRIQNNFTGFIQTSQTLSRTSGRGDLIEQQNNDLAFGITGRYRSPVMRPWSWLSGTLEVGVDARLDLIDQQQSLLEAVRNRVWDRRVDATVRGVDLGLWGDLDWHIGDYVNARVGMRATVLSYEVNDRLGNFVPITRPQDQSLPGYRRSSIGATVGPRTSIEVRARDDLSVMAAYGQGYRSPQARTLEDGEQAPYTTVHSADLGLRYKLDNKLTATASVFWTKLSDDVAFDASEGRLEPLGASRRMGTMLSLVARPVKWLVSSVSATYVHAIALEPPPPTAEEPTPPFTSGQAIPYVPPLVVRMDIGVEHTFDLLWGKYSPGIRAGLGYSHLGRRPLPFDERSRVVNLVDLSLGGSWGPIDLGIEFFNLFNSQYAAVEYSFASDWDPDDGVRSRIPARHTAAGSPLSWMLSLGVRL